MNRIKPGYVTGYVIERGIYVGNRPDVMKIMLYNGRRVLVFAKSSDHEGGFNPGALVQFHCDNEAINFDCDQSPGTYYNLDFDWACRITDEATIKTFFLGARILSPNRVVSKARGFLRNMATGFRRYLTF